MNKVAIAFSTKDQVELSQQTLPPLAHRGFDLWWADGSRTEEGIRFFEEHPYGARNVGTARVFGGPDAGIAWKLSALLAAPEKYAFVGLAESDVLLEDGWFEETMALFDIGKRDGLSVGAASPRSYVDRCLIQRDGHAVMHNLGAGMVIFTREAAEIILRSFRTAWWPTNRYVWAQLSGIDVATYACFRGNEQMVTTDWQFEAQLASHGLASLALTPSKASMIGQVPPLEQQGLELTTRAWCTKLHDDKAFALYRANLDVLRRDLYKSELPGIIHRDGAGMLFFPHQLGYLAGGPTWQGTTELKWSQGFGPFAYRAGPGGASLSLRIAGSCSFLVTGGDAGAGVTITDTRSGFNFAPDLPGQMETFAAINVPGGPVPRTVTMEMGEGAVFYGLQTTDPQMLDETFRFDWSQLPSAT